MPERVATLLRGDRHVALLLAMTCLHVGPGPMPKSGAAQAERESNIRSLRNRLTELELGFSSAKRLIRERHEGASRHGARACGHAPMLGTAGPTSRRVAPSRALT